MWHDKRIAVVLPAYNEARFIGRVIANLPRFVDIVCVVDDASDDGTLEAARAVQHPGAVYVRHGTNRGVGAAIATGYKRCLDAGADVVAVMGADDQMDARELALLVAPVAAGTADYAKGDRLCHPHVRRRMPAARYWGNRVLSWLSRYCCGYPRLRDSQCGFTAASAAVLRRIDLDAVYPRYGFPNDLLFRLFQCGARVVQVPVTPIYGEEVSGISWYTALVRVPRLILLCGLRRLMRPAPVSLPADERSPCASV